MDSTFTEFLRALEPGRQADARRFEALWKKLRDALVHELRRRGLWSAPPARLGVCGCVHWCDGGALDELLSDCYSFIFLDRLAGLRAQLAVKENVEGLVFRNIHNFLYDRQKKSDPMGFRTFQLLQRAARRAIDAGVLDIVGGESAVVNTTVLAFRRSPRRETVVPELEAHVRSWCDSLLPRLITARGKAVDAVVEELEGRLEALCELSVAEFRFADVAQPLKAEIRARWGAVGRAGSGTTALERDGGGRIRAVRVVEPDRGIEEREAFEKLSRRVSEDLELFEGTDATGNYLRDLWRDLSTHAAQPRDDRPMSRRQVARRLGIPRDRLAGLYADLGRRIESCRRSLYRSSWDAERSARAVAA